MIKKQEYRQQIVERLGHLRNRKILIYGTGTVARRLVGNLYGFSVIGIVDRLHFGGSIAGVPIILWDEIQPGDVEVVIIAASSQNYEEIYQRIVDKCMLFGINIYGENGQDLITAYGWSSFTVEGARYYRRSETELRQLIAQYDAVSFDLFDTLVMRKTLEPADVFDIVEDRIRRKGILIPRFKVLRREAELQSGSHNIYQIYEIISEFAGLTKAQEKIVLETELACERSVLLPRKKMVELLEYARNLGKRVSIISDMYLGAEILEEFLKELHIEGYDNIYVSCDCGVSKNNGLFERYLRDVDGMVCLHIGDNIISDVKAPMKCGIASYGIKSAFEMIKLSNFRYIMSWAHTCNEKNLLGLIIAELFNNPFALYGTSGIVQINSLEMLGKTFAAPLATIYMLELLAYLRKNPIYKNVVFGARDGFLFQRLYDRIKNEFQETGDLPESVYLLASRKLCIRAALAIGDPVNSLMMYRGTKTPEDVLTDIIGLPKERVTPYDAGKHMDEEEYYAAHLEMITKKSKSVLGRYLEYIKGSRVDMNQKNLFCDFISRGTVQHLLNQIFYEPMDGLYVCRCVVKDLYSINARGVYEDKLERGSILYSKHCFLETIFTSPEASVEDMREGGRPEFAHETRTKEEIRNMCKEQQGIEEFFFDYYKYLWIEGKELKNKLPETLIYMCDQVEYVGECNHVTEIKLYEDLGNTYLETLKI
ncbi:hypothetical protein [Acetatifactor muris]|uniref:hypothetical protein n=1 Tax=Acetatifactor muris TaxID=879566 RepID=UPI0023F440B6|nr:hypothetical protein [Acetatifactor muris]